MSLDLVSNKPAQYERIGSVQKTKTSCAGKACAVEACADEACADEACAGKACACLYGFFERFSNGLSAVRPIKHSTRIPVFDFDHGSFPVRGTHDRRAFKISSREACASKLGIG